MEDFNSVFDELNQINEDRALNKLKLNMHSTHMKDYEAFAISVLIYTAVKNNLNFQTQQAIRRKDGKLYLIDLYLPDVNLAIECDEGHHLTQVSTDAVRQSDIISENNCEFIRLNATANLSDLIADIDTAIDKIKNKKSELNTADYDYNAEVDIFDEFLSYAASKNSYLSNCKKDTQNSSMKMTLKNGGHLELTILNEGIYSQIWLGKNNKTPAVIEKMTNNLFQGYDLSSKVFGSIEIKPNNNGVRVRLPGSANAATTKVKYNDYFDWLIKTSEELVSFYNFIIV